MYEKLSDGCGSHRPQSTLLRGGGAKTVSHRDRKKSTESSCWWCFRSFWTIFGCLNWKTHRNGILGDFGSFWIGKKHAKIPRCVSEVHFGHFLAMFYHFFAACQARKYCNLQCFSAFGMKKHLLATC